MADNGEKYEKGRVAELRSKVNNLITGARDTKFITMNNGTINTYTFEEWVQIIYGGRSPFCDEFHDVVEEISHNSAILASILYKHILWDYDCAKRGYIFSLKLLDWIEKEDK